MGVDVVMFSKVENVTQEQMDELKQRLDGMTPWKCVFKEGFCDLSEPGFRYVEWYTTERYWGPGYERGPWLLIWNVMSAMFAVFGNVYYGGDTHDMDQLTPWTGTDSKEFWGHWNGDHWNDYRRGLTTFPAD